MQVADRWDGFGQTVFAENTALAIEHGAINLGQGFPDFDGPDFVKEAPLSTFSLNRVTNSFF
jgi:N-succinyldiaminopimelate aminotransferase